MYLPKTEKFLQRNLEVGSIGVARNMPHATALLLAAIVAFRLVSELSAAAIAFSIFRSSSESPAAMANSLASSLMS